MSLHLDARQRAILAEMNVAVDWWPDASKRIATNDHLIVAPVEYPPVSAPSTASEPALAAPAQDRATAHARSPMPEPTAATPVVGSRSVVTALDWPGLQAAVQGCQACGLCQGRTQAVFGVGPEAEAGPAPVDWLVVGEAPGEQEDLRGEPFVGPAGQLLDQMLKALGLQRRAQGQYAGHPLRGVYVANVIKCRPPGNRNPTPEEVAQCAPYLHRQIELLKPKIILALGKFAAHTLLAATVPEVHAQPLGRLRGQVHHYRGVPVVVSYHPAYLLRNLPDKAKAWDDLCLAHGVASGA